MNQTNTSGADNMLAPSNLQPYSVFSYDIFVMTKLILNCVVKPLIVVIGVPSNVISCLVFWRQGLRDHMNVCLFLLALVDLCFLLISVLFSVDYYLITMNPILWEQLDFKVLIYCVGVSHGFRIASGLITMIIALDRCVCVLFPLKATSLMSARSMGVLVLTLIVLSQVGFFSMPISYTLVKTGNRSDSPWQFAQTTLWKNNQVFFDILEKIIMMIVVPMTTFIVVSLATAVTVVRLRAAMAWREKTSTSTSSVHAHQTSLTTMLVLVSCVYILTTSPFVLMYLAELAIFDFSISGRYFVLYTSLNSIVYYFPYVNSSVNVFVYYSRSSRFRRDANAMFSLRCAKSRMALVAMPTAKLETQTSKVLDRERRR